MWYDMKNLGKKQAGSKCFFYTCYAKDIPPKYWEENISAFWVWDNAGRLLDANLPSDALKGSLGHSVGKTYNYSEYVVAINWIYHNQFTGIDPETNLEFCP